MNDLRINIRILGPIKKYVNSGESQQLELNGPITALDLVRMLQIPDNQHYVIMINEKRESSGIQLKDGDEVLIISMVTGG